MRRFMTSVLVAVAITAITSVALADNQKMADQIAGHLQKSGQQKDYKIGVKYQDGTTWLIGRVSSQQQLTTALKLVLHFPKVSRVINNMEVAPPSRTVARAPTRSLAPKRSSEIRLTSPARMDARV